MTTAPRARKKRTSLSPAPPILVLGSPDKLGFASKQRQLKPLHRGILGSALCRVNLLTHPGSQTRRASLPSQEHKRIYAAVVKCDKLERRSSKEKLQKEQGQDQDLYFAALRLRTKGTSWKGT